MIDKIMRILAIEDFLKNSILDVDEMSNNELSSIFSVSPNIIECIREHDEHDMVSNAKKMLEHEFFKFFTHADRNEDIDRTGEGLFLEMVTEACKKPEVLGNILAKVIWNSGSKMPSIQDMMRDVMRGGRDF